MDAAIRLLMEFRRPAASVAGTQVTAWRQHNILRTDSAVLTSRFAWKKIEGRIRAPFFSVVRWQIP